MRSGRSVGAPTPDGRAGPVDGPRAAAVEVDRRDDLHRLSRPTAPSPASARRWKLIGSEPLRSRVSWKPLSENALAEPALLVGAQAEQERPPEQVRQRIGRPVGVPAHLGGGVAALEPGLLDEEVRRLLDGQLAAVHPHVEDHPAGPPDGVGVEDDPEARVVVEAVLAHQQLGVHAPALDELGGVGQQAGQRRDPAGRVELEVVARVGLVDAGVADRGEVVLEHRVGVVADRRGDDVDALRVGVERRRREVRRERDDVAQELGRLDDVDPLVVGHRDEVVVDQVLAGAQHRGAVGVERGREVGRPVGLDPGEDRRLVGVRVDLAGRGDAGRLLLGQLLPAELQDLVRVEAVERPVRDQRVVALAADRPVVVPAGERPAQPVGVLLDRGPGGRHRAVQPPVASAGARTPAPAATNSAKQPGQAVRLSSISSSCQRRTCGTRRAGLRRLEEGGDALQPAGDGVEPLGERGVVAREQQEERIADGVEGEGAPLPQPQLVEVEELATDVVELDVALEARRRGQLGRVDRLDRGQVRPLVVDLPEDRVAARVAEPVVGVVEPEPGGEQRLGRDDAPEARLDGVVEALVGGAGVRARGRPGQGSIVDPAGGGHGSLGQAGAATGSGETGRGPVSARAARVAAMVVSMSAASTP